MAIRNPLVLITGQLRELPDGDVLIQPVVMTLVASTTLSAVPQIVLANTAAATFTITLPTAVGNVGILYNIKLISALAVTIAAQAAQTIDGSVSISLARIYSSLAIVSDGTNWQIV